MKSSSSRADASPLSATSKRSADRNRSFMELETVGATEQFSVSIRGLGCECACFPGGRIKL